MTKAAIRAAIRSLIVESDEDAGALFPTDNVKLDFIIDTAVEIVVVDLAEFLPEDFLDYEDINLIANIKSYTLTKEWVQIWAMLRNVTGQKPRPIRYYKTIYQWAAENVGETAEEPNGWTLKGNAIIFMPTPAVNKTAYARCWIVAAEAATMATDGPVYIPRMAHRLIPLQAVVLINLMTENSEVTKWAAIYGSFLERIRGVLGSKVQQQPRYLGGSYQEMQVMDSREKAFYDKSGFFD